MDLQLRITPFNERFLNFRRKEITLSPVKTDDGELLGRCSLDGQMGGGVVVVNGVYAGKISYIGGLLLARQNLDLARTQAIPIAGIKEMGDWVNRQRLLIQQKSIQLDPKLTPYALALGGDVMDWPLVENLERSFNQEEFRALAGKYHDFWFAQDLRSYDSREDVAFSPNEFEQNLWIEPFCLLDRRDMWHKVSFLGSNEVWPLVGDSANLPQSIGDVIAAILTEVWCDGDMEDPDEPQIVGEVNGNPVRRKVKICRKTP